MRKWHRWLSVFFGIVLLWVAATGVASHVAVIYQDGGIAVEKRGPPGQAAVVTGQPAPQRRSPSVVGFLHHLHSGETFGPVGVVISLLGGIALLFFAGSGLWMYIDMFRRRRKAQKSGVFWQ